MEIKKNVEVLNNRILNGDILGVFEDMYHDDVVMVENEGDPRVGKAANREYEKNFVENLQEFHGAEIKNVAVGDDVSMVEWFMDMTFKDGSRVQRNQVAVQTWKDGKVIQEKFFYNN